MEYWKNKTQHRSQVTSNISHRDSLTHRAFSSYAITPVLSPRRRTYEPEANTPSLLDAFAGGADYLCHPAAGPSTGSKN